MRVEGGYVCVHICVDQGTTSGVILDNVTPALSQDLSLALISLIRARMAGQ